MNTTYNSWSSLRLLHNWGSLWDEYDIGRIYGPLDAVPVVMSMSTLPDPHRYHYYAPIGSELPTAKRVFDLERLVDRLVAELQSSEQHVAILTNENQHVARVWGEVADWCRSHVGDRVLMGRRVCDEVLRLLKATPTVDVRMVCDENYRLKKTLNDIRHRADLAVNHSV